jgi:predicted TPR repeat methyltransferase
MEAAMVTNSTKVHDFFDGYAAQFDSIYGHSEGRGAFGRFLDQKLRKTMFLRFREVLRNTANPDLETILDVGCGPGHYCQEFLKQGKQVTGLDIAEAMLEIASRRTGDSRHVTYVAADYLRHEFDQPFDAACLMGFFDYVEDPVAVFKKLRRDVTQEIYASFPTDRGFLALQRRVRYRLRNCPLYLYSRRDIENIMAAAGLSKFDILDFGRDYFVKVSLRPGAAPAAAS